MQVQTPETIANGRYALLEVAGRGGMGTVWRAQDLRLHGKPCAIKILDRAAGWHNAHARFQQEIRLTSALQSPHIVQVSDAGVTKDGRPYVVMDFVQGRPSFGSDACKPSGQSGARHGAGPCGYG